MSKAENLKKALAEIHAKANRLQFAEAAIQKKLDALQTRSEEGKPKSPGVEILMPHGSDGTLSAPSGVATVATASSTYSNWSQAEARDRVRVFLSAHPSPDLLLEACAETVYLVNPPFDVPHEQIFQGWLETCRSVSLPVEKWTAEMREWVNALWDATLGVQPG